MRYPETPMPPMGPFALQNDIDDHAMMLLLDLATFYEFIPIDQTGIRSPRHLRHGKSSRVTSYAPAITSCNGLRRYAIGDTVTVESGRAAQNNHRGTRQALHQRIRRGAYGT